MKLKKPFLNQDKRKSNSYLKYEEGEIVSVKPKTPVYPPFLNDKEETEVKQFKDIRREEESRHYQVNLRKIEDQQKESGPSSTSSLSNSSPGESPKETRKIITPSLLMKEGIWLMIIGGLVYYSVPMYQYFASETPNLSNVNKTVKETKDTIDKTSEKVDSASKTLNSAKETSQKVVNKVTSYTTSVNPTDDSDIAQLSHDQWLSLFSSLQNQKQEQLVSLQQATSSYVSGQTSLSRYRLQVRGVTTKLERLQNQLEDAKKGQDLSDTGSVVTILDSELSHLENMSMSLSVVSGDSITQIFNTEVGKQNDLTVSYKASFKSLLDKWGIHYTEQNGKIVYN